ncbi:MAG: hypothetical protein AAF658_22655, partial [Myxococcota bacterium]
GRNLARWYAIEEVLFGATNGSGQSSNASRGAADDPDERGLITQFQDDIQFTVVLYNSPVRFHEVGAGATQDTSAAIEPDFGGRQALAEFFAGQVWSGGTQTPNAISVVDNYLRGIREARVVAGEAPPPLYIVLATDGEPDYARCGNPNPSTIAEFLVLSEVEDARRDQTINLPGGTLTVEGVTTFSLSVGTDISANHFQDVANVGAGLPSMTTLATGVATVGTLPSNVGALSGPAGADVAATDNLYFNAYSGPSELHRAALSSCMDDGDCADGFECERNECEPIFAATFCLGVCENDGDACATNGHCSGSDCEQTSCPFDSCIEAFDDSRSTTDISDDPR